MFICYYDWTFRLHIDVSKSELAISYCMIVSVVLKTAVDSIFFIPQIYLSVLHRANSAMNLFGFSPETVSHPAFHMLKNI